MTIAPDSLMEALDDRYRLLGVIGTGGMATVYRAHDGKHDRTVALKVLHDDLAASLGPERFKREIRIAARLQHPHILGVFDSGESAGRLWFTMPFVSGESLRDRLRRAGTVPLETALGVVREAAQALAHAHKQGVIHRDIKPENILLTEDGSTLVADFGIARAVGESVFDTGVSGGLTQTGLAIGTPTYMAPEQATGEGVLDERVDQYALAAVLYEMLTGAPPFTGTNAAALIAARFTTQVTPIRNTRAEVPIDVDAAVQRALSLKPADRFPSMSAFAQAVSPSVTTPTQFAGTGATITAAPGAVPTARGWKIGVAALGVIALAAIGMLLVNRRTSAPADGAPIRIAVLPFQNLGDTTDAYFADGVGDELRGKLLKLPGVQVIARASSALYAGTTKTPEQIAKELDVGYLLTGTVRWERRTDGASIVHLRPELVQVADGQPATTKWQQAFDQPLTDVTTMQVNVAEQVATQLQVTLGAGEKTQLAKVPTTNPEAYDAYLRGMTGRDDTRPAALRRRIADLERAVALDPSFADAWANLAAARSILYSNAQPLPELLEKVKEDAEHASVSAPGSVTESLAWSAYYYNGLNDAVKGEQILRRAYAIEPSNALVITRLGSALYELGRLNEALPLLRAATRIDPLNTRVWSAFGSPHQLQRHYADALSAYQRAVALSPGIPTAILNLVGVHAAMGNLPEARRTIQQAYAHMPPEELDTYLAIYFDYGWILDSVAKQRVLRAPLSAFDNDTATQHIVRSQIYLTLGDTARAREFGLRATRAFSPQITINPGDPQLRFLMAFAAALGGQRDASRRLVRAALDVLRGKKENLASTSYYSELAARTHTLNGDYDNAFDTIERILAAPGLLGLGHLRLDPMWAPLRALPRYQRILAAGTSK